MLRNRHEALVEEVLEAVVVGVDDKTPPPKVRTPMPDGLNKVD
jgi:hypothetical protein